MFRLAPVEAIRAKCTRRNSEKNCVADARTARTDVTIATGVTADADRSMRRGQLRRVSVAGSRSCGRQARSRSVKTGDGLVRNA